MNLKKRILRFIAVGAANTGVDFLIYNIGLVVFHLVPGWANAISSCFAMANSFLLNKNWTFKGREGHNIPKQTILFIGFTVSGALLNTFLVVMFSTALGSIFADVKPLIIANISKVGALAIGMVYNFVTYNYIVFKKKNVPETTVV